MSKRTLIYKIEVVCEPSEADAPSIIAAIENVNGVGSAVIIGSSMRKVQS